MQEASKVTLITGASSGIGKKAAEVFAEAGHSLVLFARRERELAELAAELRERGGDAAYYAGDITDMEDVSRVAGVTQDRFGRLDCLINNAGIFETATVEATTPSMWEKSLDTNLTGPFRVTRNCLDLLRSSNGVVIFNASIAARESFPGNAAYSASKAGLAAAAGVLREEERDNGVRVSVVYPGATYTPAWEELPEGVDPEELVSPEQVARTFLEVASTDPNASVDEVVITPSRGEL